MLLVWWPFLNRLRVLTHPKLPFFSHMFEGAGRLHFSSTRQTGARLTCNQKLPLSNSFFTHLRLLSGHDRVQFLGSHFLDLVHSRHVFSVGVNNARPFLGLFLIFFFAFCTVPKNAFRNSERSSLQNVLLLRRPEFVFLLLLCKPEWTSKFLKAVPCFGNANRL